jgi:hypothetical protein
MRYCPLITLIYTDCFNVRNLKSINCTSLSVCFTGEQPDIVEDMSALIDNRYPFIPSAYDE